MRWKNLLCLTLVLGVLASFVSCKGKETNQIIKYDISSEPVNLDPQLANDYASSLVVFNMMEGLLRINSEGKLTEGVAENYSVDESGLLYTFNLRPDAKWENGESVTANDFVFAFRRLFDPQTNSSTAKNYYCIKNARAYHRGKTSADKLGVEATGDFTLRITLGFANPIFLQLLTNAAAMPCNEKFFYETKGKYGLDADKTLSNGPFVLNGWAHNDYLSLRRNTRYVSARKVVPAGVSFIVETEKSKYRFETEQTDAYAFFDSPAESLKKYNVSGYENTVWGIALNQSHKALGNENIRKALVASFDRSAYTGRLPGYLRQTDVIVPKSITMLDRSYRDYAAGYIPSMYDPANAKKLFSRGKKEVGSAALSKITVIAPKNTAHLGLFAYASQIWQKKLSLYIKVKELESDEYRAALKKGDYDMALISLSADINSPNAVLSQFESRSDKNIFGYKSQRLDRVLSESERSGSLAKAAGKYISAEIIILSDGVFIPMYFQTDYFAVSKNVKGIVYYSADGMIDFAGAVKK